MSPQETIIVLNRKRGAIKAQLTRIKDFISTEGNKDVITLNSKLDSIGGLRTRLMDIRNGYYEIVNDDKELAPLETEVLNLEETCEDIQVRIMHLISKESNCKLNSNSNSSNSSSEETAKMVNIRLPEIHLPKFSGSYHDWYSFKEQFESIIDSNKQLGDSQKLFYLKSSLCGIAKDVVASDDSYTSLFKSLKQRFENKKLIVNSHFNEILSIDSITHESAKGLRAFVDCCQKHLRGLELVGLELNEFSEVLLIHLIMRKLDKETRKQFEMSLASSELPKWDNFLEFLSKRCIILENTQTQTNTHANANPKVSISNHRSKTLFSENSNSNRKIVCSMCENPHPLYKCESFLALNELDRYNMVKKCNLCLNCLCESHKIAQCKSKRLCNFCNLKHHSLLHRSKNRLEPQQLPDSSTPLDRSHPALRIEDVKRDESAQSVSQTFCSGNKKQNKNKVILSTCVILIENKLGERIPARAILDSGSESNFVTQGLSNTLELKKYKIDAVVSGINGSVTNLRSSLTATISNREGTFTRTMDFLVVPKITDFTPSCSLDLRKIEIPQALTLADPHFDKPNRIDILIGGEAFYEIIEDGKYSVAQLIFQKSVFGYIASGSVPVRQGSNKNTYCAFVQKFDSLDDTIKEFWKIENVKDSSNSCVLSEEEQFCENHFISTHKRTETGRYIVKLPLKENWDLGNSRDFAERRLNQVWKNLMKNSEMEKLYVDFMEEYESLHHMEKVTEDRDMDNSYYLPHHGVLKSNKLRVVFDASAPSSNGKSLNDILLKGKVNEDVYDIMVRFRLHRYVFTTDIEKMYRQILIAPEQRKLLRILWKKGLDEPVQTYELQTVTYGTSNAPFLAIRTLKQLALDQIESFPLAAAAILNDTYMDDILTGADKLDVVKALQSQLIELLHSAGMKLHKWNTNSTELLSISSNNEDYSFSSSEETKALGVLWKPKLDVFTFKVNTDSSKTEITKRKVLSDIARLFDPLGLLGPVIARAKIFMQKLWIEKLEWNDPLPEALAQLWLQFTTSLRAIENLNIDRYVLVPDTKKLILHGFSDASESAYGCVIYIQSITDSQVSTKLLTSKSLVAPLKTISIPKLELSACLLLAKLTIRVLHLLKLPIDDVFLWNDSTIALAWIQTPPYKLKTFVANRVSKIQELTSKFHWHHVSSGDNPADIISRGSDPAEISSNRLWWYGPGFLSQEMIIDKEETLPTLDSDTQFLKEMKDIVPVPVLTTRTFNNFGHNYDKPSLKLAVSPSFLSVLFDITNSFMKLIRIISFLFRFSSNCKVKNKISGPLTTQELNHSQVWLVKQIQELYFSEELRSLKKGLNVSGNSKIKSLQPFLDTNNVIRVGGRLQNSSLSYDSKHPVILPKHHKLSEMIFCYFHKKFLHLGPQSLLHHVRQQFWIVNSRFLARKVVHNCIQCFRYKPLIANQVMGLLPSERVNPSPPFFHSAVDYCGPFEIKYKNQRKGTYSKIYIALFVCLVTKAVHLEIVTDLTSEAFIASLKRFFSRRGKSYSITSDNSTTFVGAKSELKRFQDLLSKQEEIFASYLATERIEWKFIPPRSPNFGGLWEAGVKSVKYHLKRTLGNSRVTFEEFLTILNQIEMILNSRPLCPLSTDIHDLEALSPAHFLIGRSFNSLPEPSLLDLNENLLSRWQKITKMTQHIWKQWKLNYLNHLQQRHKWKFVKDDVKIGSMVLLKEDNLPPGKWALGRILETIYGPDKHIRIVKVKTASGIYTRSISKICILPLNTDFQS